MPGSDTPAKQAGATSTALDNLLARYPAGSIHTNEEANRAGDDVHKMHALIDAEFAEDQKACYAKFFATACLDEAKERHRVAAARIRSIEIEVNKFKRLANVRARDKAMTARREKEAAESAAHAEASQLPAVSAASHAQASSASSKDSSEIDDRIAKHEQKIRKRRAAEAEKAEQREKNIAAFEKKRKESEARQREIAAKKLEKERAKRAKSASESK